MEAHVSTLDAGGRATSLVSPRISETNNGSRTKKRCGGRTRSANLLAVFALGTIAGCTTIVLQLAASGKRGPRHAGDAPLRTAYASESSNAVPPLRARADGGQEEPHQRPAGSRQWDTPEDPPYVDVDPDVEIPAAQLRRRPLVDRRFTGQRTGRPPKPEEEVPHRPPAPRDAPFGWGTDWVAGVGIPSPTGGHAEDVIEPGWCKDSAGNQTFVEEVMARRSRGRGSTAASERVVACTRTRDRGRFLPEWVAYHWAMGVDEIDIYDDGSVDDTREVLEPFVRAGIVNYQLHRTSSGSDASAPGPGAAAPLNECLDRYRELHDSGDPLAPRWTVLIDTDEFLWAGENLKAVPGKGLAELLAAAHSSACCLQVSVVQHGTSGFQTHPRGLVMENFLTHADPASAELNGPPKVVVNFRPVEEEGGGEEEEEEEGKDEGVASADGRPATLADVLGDGIIRENTGNASVTDGATAAGGRWMSNEECRCGDPPDTAELVVRRYPLTREDFYRKERRYSEVEPQQQEAEVVQFDVALEAAAMNDHRSEGMLEWSCVVRRLLSRVANGLNPVTGSAQSSLSPHHPIIHGVLAMDPHGQEELRRTEACVSVVRSSPTATGTTWGGVSTPLPPWLQRLCSTRYVFVHSFEDTGDAEVLSSLAAHPWVTSHVGQTAAGGGGSAITSAIPTAAERKAAEGISLFEMCGCVEGDSPGCWRHCPKLQRRLLAPEGINQARRQLVLDWLLRFDSERSPSKNESPVVLVERDQDDMLVASKQGLFPFVATSVITMRHPLCTPVVAGGGGGRGEGGGEGEKVDLEGVAAGLREWREVWHQVLTHQVSHAVSNGGSVWIVRFEDLLSQREEVTSALWAAVGLPPIAPYIPDASRSPSNGGGGARQQRRRRLMAGDAMAKASPAVRERAVPRTCRSRVGACEGDPACKLELLRSASLLEFFGYGGEAEIINSQRFLWGNEELEWLGKRLSTETDDAFQAVLDGAASAATDTDDEPSVILPQAPARTRRRRGGR